MESIVATNFKLKKNLERGEGREKERERNTDVREKQ